jgi:UDP-N-acetylmuramoyl-L-alanyl-D-glutamate--2,6-diaminopimelate ligase
MQARAVVVRRGHLAPRAPEWSRELLSVGVTGTNGKTTTTAMVAAVLERKKAPVARVTTVGFFLGDEKRDLPANYSGYLSLMRECLDRGGRYAAAEMTSEALALGFANAWPCQIGVFTNLTRDHLDSHGSAEHYLASKAQLFMQLPPDGAAVLNGCDPASEMLSAVVPGAVRTLRYGVPSRGEPRGPLDLVATRVEPTWDGTFIDVRAPNLDAPTSLRIRAIGDAFAENALAAVAVAIALGVPGSLAADALSAFSPPSGRFEVVSRRPYVVVDYAHTPDAMARTLVTARRLSEGRLTVVFGCGGNRDQAKRPAMGAAASLADRIVLTSDNPRDEDPKRIANAIRAGVGEHDHVRLELDRERAINLALDDARADDVVVIAGKGHEDEQIVGNERRAFSDQEVVRRVFLGRQEGQHFTGEGVGRGVE